MRRKRFGMFLGAAGVLAAAVTIALVAVLVIGESEAEHFPKFGSGDPDAQGSETATPGEGPIGGYDAFISAQRTYPAEEIPPTLAQKARATFEQIAKNGDPGNNHFYRYGPQQDAVQPGVLAFTGATNTTASRVTALVIAPTCGSGNCRMWVGVSGGGVWRTNDALASNPSWTWLNGGLAQNSVGSLAADPNDPSGNTLYLGTGEANRCSSGCEAGVGIYKSTDGGGSWTKLADSCVSNSRYACVTAGQDAFLGRGIGEIVVDPTNPNHLFVASALGVRGLSHTIGSGGTTRFPPNANNVGLYESTDGGKTFTEVWDGNGAAFGVRDVGLDPLDPETVYASAFDQGAWRRSPTLDGSATPYDFRQVFAPRFPGGGTDRTMFDMTVKNGKTRIYLTDGTANSTTNFAEFWRTDNANQPAGALLASQTPGLTVPGGNGNPFPTVYSGWQRLTSSTTSSPYYATVNFCTGQCWYDQNVFTPKNPLLPDTVYVIGSFQYGELPCLTKGVGCGNNRSNGRGVLYSDTAGDPDPSNNDRTFTDLTYDAQDTTATWCALPAFSACLFAPNGIHPDQHQIVVNPSNPNQIFEGSDGGLIRTDGSFQSTSSQCTTIRQPLSAGSTLACQRLLSRIPNLITHINQNLDTLQFIDVAINPSKPCEVMGGTQDNGTWSNPGCDTNTWSQIIYGDGGNAGYDGANSNWRFNEFTSGFSDSNFRNGDPEKWVITSAPLVNSGEVFSFYWPQVGDPNPPAGAHPIFSGGQHVWRTWAFGAGTPGAVPQDKEPNIAFYEANCPEFTTFGGQVGCGDYQPMGGDLTSATYGSDRTGGTTSWIARNKADHGTLWATTSAGRVFVTHNADAINPADVVWHRIDNPSSPTRFPSSIYPDIDDPNHAWVTYSGYNASTPTTPGHVFSVLEGGTAPGSGQFTNLNLESGTSTFPTPDSTGDLPASDVVRDDRTGKLYVSTDFGVLWNNGNDKGNWHVVAGLPRFEVMHLELEPSARVPTCVGTSQCPRVLYAATHSQGIWALNLPGN